MNETEWQAASARIGCSDSRGYHCVPDKFHESLIEFCYNKTHIFVAKGTEYGVFVIKRNIDLIHFIPLHSLLFQIFDNIHDIHIQYI